MYVYGAIIGSSIIVGFVTRHMVRRTVEKLGVAYYHHRMGGECCEKGCIRHAVA